MFSFCHANEFQIPRNDPIHHTVYHIINWHKYLKHFRFINIFHTKYYIKTKRFHILITVTSILFCWWCIRKYAPWFSLICIHTFAVFHTKQTNFSYLVNFCMCVEFSSKPRVYLKCFDFYSGGTHDSMFNFFLFAVHYTFQVILTLLWQDINSNWYNYLKYNHFDIHHLIYENDGRNFSVMLHWNLRFQHFWIIIMIQNYLFGNGKMKKSAIKIRKWKIVQAKTCFW